MEEVNISPEQEPVKRPDFLKVLCILSFVAAGFGIIGSIIGFLGMKMMQEKMLTGEMEGMEDLPGMKEAMVMWPYMTHLLIVSLVVATISLFGVLKMWNLKKIGFHIYTAAQILSVALPIIIVGPAIMSFWNMVLPALFILLYSLNLKHMN